MKLRFRKKKKEDKKTLVSKRRKAQTSKIRKSANADRQKKKSKLSSIRKPHLPEELPNIPLLSLSLAMFIGGLLMIFSASAIIAYSRFDGDAFFYFKRQILWICLGILAGGFFYILPLRLMRRASVILLSVSILLLLYMLPEALFGNTVLDGSGNVIESGVQMPFVNAINGATRWINLGSFSLQPSELVKFSLIIYLSAWLTRDFKIDKKNLVEEHFNKVLFPFIGLAGLVSTLILAQRDFDTTVIIFLSILTVYYMSGEDRIHTWGSAIILFFSSVIGSLALIIEDYRRQRVLSFIDIMINGRPTEDNALAASFQVWNGLVAIGSGGLFGLGYGESRQKLGFLQDAAFTDSIFVIIGEEFGFFGILLVVSGFLYFASLGLKIAKQSNSDFGALLAIGMTSWIVIQALLNIAANLAIIPFGGMPLPFFTYGGSSTIITFMSIGVILNVSRQRNKIAESTRGETVVIDNLAARRGK